MCGGGGQVSLYILLFKMVLNAAIDLKDGACTGEVATGALRSCNRAGRMAVHSRLGY